MRNVWALAVFLVACSKTEVMPPPIGDPDGSVPLPPPGHSGGGDGGTSDAGSALATASNPKGVFVANGFVYYTNFATGASDGTVSVVPTTGGAPTDLATGQNGPWAITVAASTVFFTLAPTSGTGGLSSVSTSGGGVTSIQSGVTGAVGVVTDPTNVYWTNDPGAGGGALVWFALLSGGAPKQLLDFGSDLTPTGLAIFGTDLYVPTSGTQAAVLQGGTSGAPNLAPLDSQYSVTFADAVATTDTVYATIDDVAPSGAIVSFPRLGGPAKTVAGSLNHPARLALDGTNLYFTAPNDGDVWVVDLTQSSAPTLVASGLAAPLPIAVADAVYVGASDSIVRIPKL